MGSILKIIGVLAFSMTSGALTSIITNLDAQQAKFKEKIATLESLQAKHKIPSLLSN
jgi:hypothetical protein